MAINRKFNQLIIVAVITSAFFWYLTGMNDTSSHFLDKIIFTAHEGSSEKLRVISNLRYFPSQILNNKTYLSTNVLLKNNYSKQSSKKNSKNQKSTKIKDRAKKNILKYQTNKSSTWTKWLKLWKNLKINFDNRLLVIVTTWVPSKEKQFVHENIVRLWASWPKLVQPIAYLLPAKNNTIDKNKDFINILIKYGWIVRPIPKVSCGDVPVLKFMILDAKKLFPKSSFYGFANSDILFCSGLIETLKVTKQLVPDRYPVLVVGQRTNFNLTRRIRFANPESVLQASKNGSLMKGIAIDYFITNNLFPWDKIPDIVVGRIIYDNWMVYFGISQDAIVIDTSKTLTALHQTTADGNAAGWRHAHRYCNKNMIARQGKEFKTRWGYTWCVPHQTLRNLSTGKIELATRKVSWTCNPRPPLLVFHSTKTNTTRSTVKPQKGNARKT